MKLNSLSKITTLATLRATARAVLEAALPWSCLGCRRTGASILCDACLARVRWVSGPTCPRCGLPLASAPVHPCGRCQARSPAFSRARAIAYYHGAEEETDPFGACIRALKYARRRGIAQPLSELLCQRFPFDPGDFDLVVPVPLHLERLRHRGFNQALLLSRPLARRFGLPLARRALLRVRPTPAQVGLSEVERRRNLLGAFAVAPGASLSGLRVLLVDDVMTSTATAEACARALRGSGASSVDVLTLARALLR